jgi:hypothetical protein
MVDREYAPVLTKRDFVRRFLADEFGNRGPNWNTLNEFLDSGYKGLVHIRNRVAGGPTFYDVRHYNVADKWLWLTGYKGYDARDFYLAGMAPTKRTLFQGEVMRSYQGLYLYYSTVAKPMRDSLKEGGRDVSGIIAVGLLRHYLCHRSYEWLMELLDRYPNHVVEFSTYGVNWGTVPGFNTVFWEVRNY